MVGMRIGAKDCHSIYWVYVLALRTVILYVGYMYWHHGLSLYMLGICIGAKDCHSICWVYVFVLRTVCIKVKDLYP